MVREIKRKSKFIRLAILFMYVAQVSILAITVIGPEDEGPLVPLGGYDYYAYDLITLPATNVEATSSVLNGWYGWGGTDPATCGFRYSTEFPVNSTNVTCSGTFTNESVAKAVLGLNSSDVYYYFIWALNSSAWYRSYNNESFLTRPSGPPNDFEIDSQNSSGITLSWDNVTDYQDHPVGEEFIQSTIIRYSSTSQPTHPTDGILGYWGTDEQCSITGLNLDTQYYFSAWTHCRDNISMNSTLVMAYQNSSEFSTLTATTQGGQYNISIRYENRTYGPVNLTKYGPHKMIIYYYGQNLTDYYGETDYIIFWNNATNYEQADNVADEGVNETIYLIYTPDYFVGVYGYNNSTSSWESISDSYWSYDDGLNSVNISHLVFDTNTTFVKVVYCTKETFVVEHDEMAYFDNNWTNFSQGRISFNVNKTVKFISFHWNDSDENINRCNRMIVTELGQRDYDMFIRDDLPVYGEGAFTRNATLVKYIYSFIDETGLFTLKNNPRAYIYIYDNEDNKLIIHSEYFDYTAHINPWLVYEQQYFIGVTCDEREIERIGVAPAFDNLEPEVRIPYEWIQDYGFYDLINIDTGWTPFGFYVVYEDTTFSTQTATFTVYNMSDITETPLQPIESITSSYNNFTFVGDTSWNYVWEITAVLDDPTDAYDGTYWSGEVGAFGGMEPIIPNGTLDAIMRIILGPSPMYYDPDATGEGASPVPVSVPWTYIIIFGVCFVWLTTMGKLNVSIAGIGIGAILGLSGGVMLGINQLYNWYAWWEGPSILLIGVFIVAISIVSALGGVER